MLVICMSIILRLALLNLYRVPAPMIIKNEAIKLRFVFLLSTAINNINIQHKQQQMIGQPNSSGQQLQSQQSRDLTQIRKQIQLSNLQLLQLTYNDEKFMNHIDDLNNRGINCLNNQQQKQAVLYFNQNQKVLEYAASCGKTIDRSAIVVTLHNQACVNQKLWDLQKSANYIQAIIYNINYYFQTSKTKLTQFQQPHHKESSELDQLSTYAHKKQLFALYHLQFCAVNSQIRKHTISVNSAKSAISIMKEVCNLSHMLTQNILYTDIQDIKLARNNSAILKQLALLDEDLEVRHYQKYFNHVRDYMADKSRHRINNNQQDFKSICSFSIGKLMQLVPATIAQMQAKHPAHQWVKYQNIINIALYLGVSYFTVGTQLRFISSQQNTQDNNQMYKLSQDFLISQVYHIYAIMIVLKYVPVRTIFLNHLLSSFNNHYQIDLEKTPSAHMQPNQDKSIEIMYNPSSSVQFEKKSQELPQQSNIQATVQFRDKNNQIGKKKISENNVGSVVPIPVLMPNILIQSQEITVETEVKKKTSRIKSPKLQRTSTSHKSKGNQKSHKYNQKKIQTQKNIHTSKQKQKSNNKSSKSKSSKQKNQLFNSARKNKKQTDPCIYTMKSKKDTDQNEKIRNAQSRKSIEKSKKKSMKERSGNKKANSQFKSKSKSKDKHNLIINFESEHRKTFTSAQVKQKSKSKNKAIKQKIKMNKVQGIKR